jgi:ribulose-bisphosphate carboxylase large chain
MPERARFARDHNAGGLLVAPGLVGFDAMRRLAEDDSIGLPILGHPALLGSFVTSPVQGIAHGALFGQLFRLAGADATIFPHHGGRFSFSRQECQDLVEGTRVPMGAVASIVPVPAGGMALDRIGEIRAFYGPIVMLLIGGNLHRHPDGLVAACREFKARVSRP